MEGSKQMSEMRPLAAWKEGCEVRNQRNGCEKRVGRRARVRSIGVCNDGVMSEVRNRINSRKKENK